MFDRVLSTFLKHMIIVWNIFKIYLLLHFIQTFVKVLSQYILSLIYILERVFKTLSELKMELS